MTARPHIFDLTPDTCRGLAAQWGLPPYRADQVLDWVYRQKTADPAAMTNLSKRDRERLAERVIFRAGNVVRHQSASDGVQKLLVDWGPPGTVVGEIKSLQVLHASPWETECVMIPAGDEGDPQRDLQREPRATPHHQRRRGDESTTNPAARRTACISSQVGCPVGCRFCASGLGGLEGNLTTGQIVEQVWLLSTLPLATNAGTISPRSTFHAPPSTPDSPRSTLHAPPSTLPGVGRISHVVFMGMGEPLANFENVTRAVRTLAAPWGMGISARRITISTVGLPAQIRRLAGLDLPITLAISLHAPTDELRRQLIPWAQYVTIKELLDAGRFYFEKTGREVTLEYILLGGVNDRPGEARELARVAGRLRSNVNLIRYNEVAGMAFRRPGDDDVRRFQQVLREAGVNVHIRASRGRDIAAACGQLRHEHESMKAGEQESRR